MKSWLFLICVSVQFSAQITLKVTEIPKDTPKNATIYVAGNFNGWKQHREMITDNVCRIYNGD